MTEPALPRRDSPCTNLDPGPAAPQVASEEQIAALVDRFYALSLADDLLGPMFRATIADFPAHYRIVQDFWSHALLGTDRYQRGTPYSHHGHLKVEEVHFDRWTAAFTAAAHETLPPAAAMLALQRAAHMTMSFKAGMLPLPSPASGPTSRFPRQDHKAE
ncbi:sec-independent protein translocase protein TatC [Novosphingobium sp. Rr 2-17]|uniref:group III truncated hemoglobin n=1 Tax=Novosphingobium sp. Rr 2-17 TaxID=555793 RepID=UPI000269A7EF|nr:group III truncated hemoglobin [Novosphingobium sp. Rr 2-17]EIZ79680.1 sec-independent protein translocase protein TatC [Novosphingobium sp. Rr 2-17]